MRSYMLCIVVLVIGTVGCPAVPTEHAFTVKATIPPDSGAIVDAVCEDGTVTHSECSATKGVETIGWAIEDERGSIVGHGCGASSKADYITVTVEVVCEGK